MSSQSLKHNLIVSNGDRNHASRVTSVLGASFSLGFNSPLSWSPAMKAGRASCPVCVSGAGADRLRVPVCLLRLRESLVASEPRIDTQVPTWGVLGAHFGRIRAHGEHVQTL